MFQIFILNASRRLQADRFYTDDYREEVYTKEGMAWVDASSFKNVILRHHPELASDRPRQRQERLRAVGHLAGAEPGAPPAPSVRSRPEEGPVDG